MKKLLVFLFAIAISAISVSAQTISEARKLTDNEQYDEASAIYKSLIGSSPSNVNLYYYYGDNLLLSDNADSASIVFEKGASIDPTNPLIKIGSAKLLLDAIGVREAKNLCRADCSQRRTAFGPRPVSGWFLR